VEGKPRPATWALALVTRSLQAVVVVAALYLAARSLYLGFTLMSPILLGDQWRFVPDYDLIVRKGTVAKLFYPHNEHIIATTRIVLLADGELFAMKGYIPHVLFYSLNAATAWLFMLLTLDRPSIFERIAFWTVLLGFMWSICQFIDLISDFQLAFSFGSFFVVGCLWALGRTLTAEPKWKYWWAALAIMFDLLALFSLGGTVILIAPAAAIAIWTRRLDRAFAVFCGFHAIFIAYYFHVVDIDFSRPSGATYSFFDYYNFVTAFLGWAVQGWIIDGWVLYQQLGTVGLVSVLIAVFVFTGRALAGRAVAWQSAVLLAIACFALLDAIAAAQFRMQFGPASRYAPIDILFIVSLLCLGWRLTVKRPALRLALISCAAVLLFAVNGPVYQRMWHDMVVKVTRAANRLRAGDHSAEMMESVTWQPAYHRNIETELETLKRRRLSIFAPP
jgi:hypothetical protein